MVLDRLKQGLTPAPENLDQSRLYFSLSPNELVFIPNKEEIENFNLFDKSRLTENQISRIYKMVSCTGGECYFTSDTMASVILDKKEYGPLNKSERDIEGNMIKQVCWKLVVNRIGEITDVIR